MTGQDGTTFFISVIISFRCKSVNPTTEESLLTKLIAWVQDIMVVESNTTIALLQF